MKTILLLLLLATSSAAAAQVRALKPSEIDPYAIYIFQNCVGYYTTVGNECASVAHFIIKSTGEWVAFPIACEDCRRWTKGMELNLEMPPAENKNL